MAETWECVGREDSRESSPRRVAWFWVHLCMVRFCHFSFPGEWSLMRLFFMACRKFAIAGESYMAACPSCRREVPLVGCIAGTMAETWECVGREDGRERNPRGRRVAWFWARRRVVWFCHFSFPGERWPMRLCLAGMYMQRLSVGNVSPMCYTIILWSRGKTVY